MKTRILAMSVLLLGLTLALAWAVAAQGMELEVTSVDQAIPIAAPADAVDGHTQAHHRPTSSGYRSAIASTQAITTYLPVVRNNYPLYYFDDFSNPHSGWYIGDEAAARWSYREGEYEMLIRAADTWTGAGAPLTAPADYSIEADMRRYAGSTSTYGLIFGLVDWNNFYVFLVYPSYGHESYAVWRGPNGGPVVDWTFSPYINPSNASNHLKVERNGTQITVYVNGHLLTTATDSAYTGNLYVGLLADAGTDVPAAVRYDNFRVRAIGNSAAADEVVPLHTIRMLAHGGPSFVREH